MTLWHGAPRCLNPALIPCAYHTHTLRGSAVRLQELESGDALLRYLRKALF